MNWKEIEREYPRAFNKLLEHYGWYNRSTAESQHYGYSPENFDIRFLYDFFDERGIYCSVYTDGSRYYESQCKEIIFDWSLESIYGGCGGGDCETRKEAEEQAFINAFEILEDVL